MLQKNQAFSVKGIQRDLSESVFSSEYAYDIRNMRLTPTDDNTGMALVSERGNKKLEIQGLEDGFNGTPIGQCIINNQLVVFCTNTSLNAENPDSIYLIYDKIVGGEDLDNFDKRLYYAELLFSGDLGFDATHPIDAYPFYENDELQKVYWVDGKNPFRYLNVAKFKGVRETDMDKVKALINVVPDLALKEEVTVTKNYDSGMFAPGTIQYSFTYLKSYGQESAIFHTTPLYYISYKDRGGNGEEKITNSFTITVKNLDHNFDYVRVYAQHRTSIDAATSSRLVAELIITDKDYVTVVDTGTIGSAVSDTDILFKIGEEIIPNAITSKNNTLFLGNIESHYSIIDDEDIESFKTVTNEMPVTFKYSYTKNNVKVPYKEIEQTAFKDSYQYQHLLDHSSQDIKVFKYKDWYRLGIQVQYKTGKWSDVIYLTDLQNNLPPTINQNDKVAGDLYTDKSNWFAVPVMTINDKVTVHSTNVQKEFYGSDLDVDTDGIPTEDTAKALYLAYQALEEAELDTDEDKIAECKKAVEAAEKAFTEKYLDNIVTKTYFSDGNGILSHLHDLGAKKIRPVIVYPNYQDREVICQGIVTPTVHKVNNRFNNAPFAQSSWFTRVNIPGVMGTQSSALQTYTFYITVFTCFHSTNSSYTMYDTDSQFYLQGPNNDNMPVTIVHSEGDLKLNGENQIQVRCEVVTTKERMESWLNSCIDYVYKSAKQKDRFRGKQDSLYLASKKLYNQNWWKSVKDSYAAKGEEVECTFADEDMFERFTIDDGKSFELRSALNAQIHRYVRWVPFFSGKFELLGVASTDGKEVHDRPIEEIDNKGKDSYRCHIGANDGTDAYGSKALLKGTKAAPAKDAPTGLSINTPDFSDTGEEDYLADGGIDKYGTIAEFRHNRAIPSSDLVNAEIQAITKPNDLGVRSTAIDEDNWKQYNREYYYVDQNVITMHSPELEFDTSVQNLDFSNAKFRIVGMTPIVSNMSHQTLTAKGSPSLLRLWSYDDTAGTWNQTAANESSFRQAMGEITRDIQSKMTGDQGYRIRMTNITWADVPYTWNEKSEWSWKEYDDTGKEIIATDKTIRYTGFAVYPWHRNGALNNDNRNDEEANNWLDEKKLSNLRYSNRNAYFPDEYIWEVDHQYSDRNTTVEREGISGSALFTSEETEYVAIGNPDGSGKAFYSGNIDETAFPTTLNDITGSADDSNRDRVLGYPIIVAQHKSVPADTTDSPYNCLETRYNWTALDISYGSLGVTATDYTRTSLGCRIKYKSTPHLVIGLPYYDQDNGTSAQSILPTFGVHCPVDDFAGAYTLYPINSASWSSTAQTLWWNDCSQVHQDVIPIYKENGTYYPSIDFSGPDDSKLGPQYGWLWLGEMYKEVDEDSRFGGTSNDAIANNVWYPCGDAIDITETDNDGNETVKSSLTVVWEEGDTYYQRYDHIKTYPFTLEDQNSITDIVSFMVETRVNLDGRYDKNRGNKDNTVMSSANFNQLNEVYSQTNNMFTYYFRDPNKLSLDKWTSQVTWSLTKTLGDLVDQWTHITLANTLDLDGKNGPITSLQKSNDQIIAFQDNAVSMIMYNENMQISTTAGVPVEIGNSGKVNGYRVISDTAGCNNKWSIVNTDKGVFFVDGLTKTLYLYGDSKCINLSDALGMSVWFNNNTNSNVWNPQDWGNIVSYYDTQTNDVYFITAKEALAYSTMLAGFSGFYSYNKTPYMASIRDHTVALHKDANSTYQVWEQNTGEYNTFFEEVQPYSLEVVVNADRLYDKTFTNVDFRAESANYEKESSLKDGWNDDLGFTFNKIYASNEYQSNSEELVFAKYGHSNLKRKFRVWRADIPRDKRLWNQHKIDRVRNTWIHLKLEMEPNGVWQHDTAKTTLHDVNVTYYV